MKKINIFGLLFAILFMAGCDYNEDNFGDLTPQIKDAVNAEMVYEGTYPAVGYFSDKATVQTALNGILIKKYAYCDAGSSVKVSDILYGDVTPGFSAADASYTLTDDEYIAMGTDAGKPGKYKNFDGNMDVDAYLKAFCATKYASLAAGKIVSISYKFYASGAGTTTKTNSYKKTADGWTPVELKAFSTDISYTLVTEDYDAMGTASGTPGKYDNFDANMDTEMYLSTFLKLKYPYTAAGKTAQVTYKFYASGATSDRNSIFKYDGTAWTAFNPYADVVAIGTKMAEMSFDGTSWILKRLMGGSKTITLSAAEYVYIVDWVKANKSEYMKDDKNEFYTGSSTQYNNVSQSYSNWKATDPHNEHNKSDADLQKLMDDRIAEGIMTAVLPKLFSTPDSGISIVVVYKTYGGRGSGDYAMSFLYNDDKQAYERISDPVKVG